MSDPFAHLSGISLPVTITARSGAREAQATGGFLFTHHGYSGPSVLDVSHVAVRSLAETRRARAGSPCNGRRCGTASGKMRCVRAGRARCSRRSAPSCPIASPKRSWPRRGVDPSRPLAQLGRAERLRLIDTLVRGALPWTGDEGYKKAEVTGGGVSLAEIDPRTLESRRHKGLFLCGEMLDAFGPIGGYNFLWAWATGRAAGIGARTASLTLRRVAPKRPAADAMLEASMSMTTRILIVEDHADSAEFLRLLLEPEGYLVKTTAPRRSRRAKKWRRRSPTSS